jgi:putative MFS transporter
MGQWKLIATANLADLLDFFDFFLIGYVLAFITKEWQLTYWQGAVILLSSGLGAVPGAFSWGWVADRIGRRKVFVSTALNVALATGVMYFTPGQGGWVASQVKPRPSWKTNCVSTPIHGICPLISKPDFPTSS